MVTCHPAASIIAHKHVPMLGQNRQRSPRFVTAHAATVTRWGHVRQILCVEFDKDGIRLLFDPKISRNGCVTKAWICPPLLFWAAYYEYLSNGEVVLLEGRSGRFAPGPQDGTLESDPGMGPSHFDWSQSLCQSPANWRGRQI